MEVPESQLFDALVKRTALQIIVTQAESGLIVYVNEAYAKAQRKSPEELIGHVIGDFDLWESEATRTAWRERLLTKGHATQRFDYVGPDGAPGASTLFTQLLSLEGVDYFISYNIDVSSIVQVELEREEALKQLKLAQGIAKIADFRYDSNTRLITGSDQLAKLLRWPPGQVALPVEDLLLKNVHPDELAGVREEIISNPDDFKFSMRYIVDEREETWIELIGSVLRDEDGNVFQWNGTIQDISERKKAEIEKAELSEKMQAAQKLESLGILAGGVAHDFNNLLVGIMGNADFALMEENLPEVAKQRLLDIMTASQRASDLTNQLLAYSGKGRFVIKSIQLSNLVQEMGELLRISISRDSSLQLHLDESLPLVNVDQTQIRQVVMNLIINASEAIDHSHGVINLTTGVVDCSPEYIRNADLGDQLTPGQYVFVEVSDNGIGMSPETQERLFEPFFTTKVSGRGLGMSAVMGIVNGHHGAIRVSSEESKGTTFKIFLPAQTRGEEQRDPDPEDAPVSGDNAVALVIDDDEIVCSMLSSALEGIHFHTLTASSGEEGLEIYARDPAGINLVLLDLTMPGLDGVEVFSRFRAINPRVKVILMSGYNQQDATQAFVGKGLAGFLQKPFRLTDLHRVVKETR